MQPRQNSEGCGERYVGTPLTATQRAVMREGARRSRSESLTTEPPPGFGGTPVRPENATLEQRLRFLEEERIRMDLAFRAHLDGMRNSGTAEPPPGVAGTPAPPENATIEQRLRFLEEDRIRMDLAFRAHLDGMRNSGTAEPPPSATPVQGLRRHEEDQRLARVTFADHRTGKGPNKKQ